MTREEGTCVRIVVRSSRGVTVSYGLGIRQFPFRPVRVLEGLRLYGGSRRKSLF